MNSSSAGAHRTEQAAQAEEGVRKDAALHAVREEALRSIARELHDDLTQRIAVLSTEIARAITEAPPTLTKSLRSIQDRVIDVSEAIRQLSHRIYPSRLEDLGLDLAIGAYCCEFQDNHKICASFKASPLPHHIPGDIASCLYFVVQESLDNVAKHAQTESVWVVLSAEPGSVTLQIIDSGVGFEAERATTGLGIHAMRQRVRLARGKIEIISEPGEGTRLEVTVPTQGTHGTAMAGSPQ